MAQGTGSDAVHNSSSVLGPGMVQRSVSGTAQSPVLGMVQNTIPGTVQSTSTGRVENVAGEEPGYSAVVKRPDPTKPRSPTGQNENHDQAKHIRRFVFYIKFFQYTVDSQG
jgi:hypothetical protein